MDSILIYKRHVKAHQKIGLLGAGNSQKKKNKQKFAFLGN